MEERKEKDILEMKILCVSGINRICFKGIYEHES